MRDYQILAIDRVREYAEKYDSQNRAYVEEVCKPFNIDICTLNNRIQNKPITINFHPDRFSNNKRTIIENLIEQGQYHGQFTTGTSNGGVTAYIGGNRFLWEQRLFHEAYPPQATDRPKYGALNLFQYIDGASVRFGSCFFTLNQNIINRCTFSYGDSSTNPTTLCTADTFSGIVAGLIADAQKNGKVLNQVVSSIKESLAILLNTCNTPKHFGRNLDYCIETHIHGDVSLEDDVVGFYMDESFQETSYAKESEELCKKYGIELFWIPKRQIEIKIINNLFRGPAILPLAQKIDKLFGNNKGVMTAALVGQGSRDSFLFPERWRDIGNEAELFQYFKQLWHTIGYFG